MNDDTFRSLRYDLDRAHEMYRDGRTVDARDLLRRISAAALVESSCLPISVVSVFSQSVRPA